MSKGILAQMTHMIRKILVQMTKNILTLLGEPATSAQTVSNSSKPPIVGDFRQAQRYLQSSVAAIAQVENMLLISMTILAQVNYNPVRLEKLCGSLQRSRFSLEAEIKEITRKIQKD